MICLYYHNLLLGPYTTFPSFSNPSSMNRPRLTHLRKISKSSALEVQR